MYMGKHASPASLASTALRLSNDHRNILLEFLQIFPQIFVKILALQIFLGFLFLSRSCVIIIFFWICILLSCYRVLAEVRSENTLSAVFANTPLLFPLVLLLQEKQLQFLQIQSHQPLAAIKHHRCGKHTKFPCVTIQPISSQLKAD